MVIKRRKNVFYIYLQSFLQTTVNKSLNFGVLKKFLLCYWREETIKINIFKFKWYSSSSVCFGLNVVPCIVYLYLLMHLIKKLENKRTFIYNLAKLYRNVVDYMLILINRFVLLYMIFEIHL